MEDRDYLNDILEIKKIMNQSTRFVSLSGLSGILAGVYALIGGWLAYGLLDKIRSDPNYISNTNTELQIKLISIALLVAFASITTSYFLSKHKASKDKKQLWTPASKQLIISFTLPMITGGVFILLLTLKSYHELIASSALIFYGLALINASKHTLSTVKYLGLTEIVLGLLALVYIGNGLLFWSIGFGILHIIYGTMIYVTNKNQLA